MAGTFDGAVCSPPASIKSPKYSTDGIKNSHFSLQTLNHPALCFFSLFVLPSQTLWRHNIIVNKRHKLIRIML